MSNPEKAYLIWTSPTWKGRRSEQGVIPRAGIISRVQRKV